MSVTASPAMVLLRSAGLPQYNGSSAPVSSADSASTAPVDVASTSASEAGSSKGPIGRAVGWLDRMTTPQKSTQGDFEGPAWFQAGFQASVEGFYLGGLAASGGCLAASMAGLWVGEKTGSQTAACVTGAVIGAGAMAAFAHAGGPASAVPAAITGALLGAFVTFRGNARSRVRDSAGNAAMLVGPFVSGPSKVAAGLGAATAQKVGGSAQRQILVGALVAGGLGAALGAIGYAPLGVVGTAALCAAGGAIGPFFGPRYSQFFRNASLKLGDHMVAGGKAVGLVKEDPSRKVTNAIGAIPSSFAKEGLRACLLADFSLGALLMGGITESIQQMDIFLNSKGDEKKKDAQPPAPAQPTAPASAPNP